jgi:hypothetical protein
LWVAIGVVFAVEVVVGDEFRVSGTVGFERESFPDERVDGFEDEVFFAFEDTGDLVAGELFVWVLFEVAADAFHEGGGPEWLVGWGWFGVGERPCDLVGFGVGGELEVGEQPSLEEAAAVFVGDDFVEAVAASFDRQDGFEAEVDVCAADFAF